MRYAIDRAALDIMRLPEPERAAKLTEAEAAFRTFIDRMIDASNTIPGYAQLHPGVIGEETWGAAMKSVCPLWPFC